MILRRFTKHVTDQNWFAVGLDVLVVITGIFLGMQVTDWNESRKEAMAEKVLVSQILVEAGRAKTEVAHYLAEHDRTIRKASDFIAVLAKDESCNFTDQELALGLITITSFPPLNFELTVVNELIQSGNTKQVTDDGLRLKFTEVRSELVLLKEQWSRYSKVKTSVIETAFPASGAVLEYIEDFDLDEQELAGFSFKTPQNLCSNYALIGQFSGALAAHIAYKAYIEQAVVAVSSYAKIVNEYDSKLNHENSP